MTPTQAEEPSGATASRARLYTTRHGALVGTPAYMSPEQAGGNNELIDERSDLYSAAVVFFELLFLKHYVAEQRSLPAMLAAILTQQVSFLYSVFRAWRG